MFSSSSARDGIHKSRSYSASEDLIEEEEITFTAGSRSASRSQERLSTFNDVTTKTYITIGPGNSDRHVCALAAQIDLAPRRRQGFARAGQMRHGVNMVGVD